MIPPYREAMAPTELFDPDLLSRIRNVVSEGDVVDMLGRARPNEINTIDVDGVEVTTEHSLTSVGGSSLVPAWMFNYVWNEMRTRGRVERDYVDRLAPGRKVKRSSAVFAILERIPEVSVVEHRPLVLGLRGSTIESSLFTNPPSIDPQQGTSGTTTSTR